MDFVAYNEILICKKPIQNITIAGVIVGYEFQIRYPSYRGCFLSCIEELRFTVNGWTTDPASVYFGLNGKWFTVQELPDLFREYWYIMTPATIRVMTPGGLPEGNYELNVYMKHRVPYTGYFGQYLTLESERTETLFCQ